MVLENWISHFLTAPFVRIQQTQQLQQQHKYPLLIFTSQDIFDIFLEILSNEGLGGLWRGYSVAALEHTIDSSLRFIMPNSILIRETLLFPLNSFHCRYLLLNSATSPSVAEYAKQHLDSTGILPFYHGFPTHLLTRYLYTKTHRKLNRFMDIPNSSVATKFIQHTAATVITSILFYPLQLITKLTQAKQSNVLAVAHDHYSQFGIEGFYFGFSSTLLVLLMKNVIANGVQQLETRLKG